MNPVGRFRGKLEFEESQAGEEVADSRGVGSGVGVGDDGIINIHADMGKTSRDAVHETLEGAQGTSSSHGHAEPLEDTLRGPKRSKCNTRGMNSRPEES